MMTTVIWFSCVIVALVISIFIWVAILPSKKYMSDIYQDMYLQHREQTKILKDLRNMSFAKNRKSKNGGK